MNLRILFLALLFVSLVGFGAGCQEDSGYAGGEPMTSEPEVPFETAITTIRSQFTQAVMQSDAATAAALYTADAKTYRPDGTMGSGAEGIAAAYQGMFDMGIKAVTLTSIESIEHGDLGWELGTYVYTGESAEGDSLLLEGEYLAVLTKTDGMWKLHRSVAFAKREPPSDDAPMADHSPMPSENQTEGMEGIQALADRFTEAIAQSDAAAAAAAYTADANLYGADGTLSSGAEAITANYQALFDAGFNAITLEAVETVQQGDVAWRLGRYTLTGESTEGAALTAKGEYASLLKQEGGVWKVYRNVAFAPRHAPSEEMTSDAM